MADELTAQELAQFQEMEKQETAETVIIEAEKAAQTESVELPPQEIPTESEPKTEPKEVPLAALQEERERRKTAEASARQMELNQARLDERMKIINDHLNPPQQPKEFPDPEKDALGALKATTEEIKKFREFQANQQNQAQQTAYVQDVMARSAAAENEFIKTSTDYGDASVFLKKSRSDELAAIGMAPHQILQTMQAEGLQLAEAALRQGKNPAELVYTLAKTRGYVKPTAVVQVQAEADADKLARIAAGQKANMSLGNLNATPQKPSINGKDLLAMDDDQFQTWLEKLPQKERSKFLGA